MPFQESMAKEWIDATTKIYLLLLHGTNLDFPKILSHLCQILKKYASFEGSDMY